MRISVKMEIDGKIVHRKKIQMQENVYEERSTSEKRNKKYTSSCRKM
jgi:hypothetical protein